MNVIRTLFCLALVLGAAHPALGQCGPLEATLVADGGIPREGFGLTVSISGNRAVIGTNPPHPDPGSAYVFERGRRGWRQVAKLKSANPDVNDPFGRGVSISGRRAVVCGEAASHVFEKVGGTWERVADLGTRWWGASISGNRLVLGGWRGLETWERVDGVWMRPSVNGCPAWDQRPDPGDRFGYPLGLSGDTAAVAAPNADDDAGAVYVLERNGTCWDLVVKLVDPGLDDAPIHFGRAVAISGDRLIVGRPFTYVNNINRGTHGAAYVYERSGGTWEWAATLRPDDFLNGPLWFGSAVSISGDKAVVGASVPRGGRDQSYVAAAYVFERVGGVWRQTAKMRTSEEPVIWGGWMRNLGISGDTVLVGAPADDGGEHEDSGLVYVFDVSDLACAADFNGDGWVDAADFQILIAAWGACDTYCPEDLDGDCNVGDRDLEILQANFGPCP